MKLDPVKVEWIVRQKEKGTRNATIAESMKVSVRRVQMLWSLYRAKGEVPELKRPGRRRIEPDEEERRIVEEAYAKYEVNALTLERVIETDCGRHIPHNRIHRVLKAMGLAKDEPRKQLRRKWVRYERKYSNSLWHTDWTLIEVKE
ncbi:MAG: hypothetical protein JRN46_06085 [Nitrososphaerota archaeon]|nr:hypothetical protein [Nitrososphaerota archaeon]